MWPFRRNRHLPHARLTGVSERLWRYDARHWKGWQLDTDQPSASARQPGAGNRVWRPAGRKDKLTHYIGAGGMRHEAREKHVRRHPLERRKTVWKIFAVFILVWMIFRWLPC